MGPTPEFRASVLAEIGARVDSRRRLDANQRELMAKGYTPVQSSLDRLSQPVRMVDPSVVLGEFQIIR